ncbi:MAG TPA: beta galactosidase jelly roll domain-containing protein [Gammaproteobacteria bacterium]
MIDWIRKLQCCGKEQSERNTVFIPVLVALITAFSGTLFGLTGSFNGNSGFWQWLTEGNDPDVRHFIADNVKTSLVDLKGEWRFATGDDMNRALPEFDDSDWAAIKVPAYWEDEGYENYNGYAWYRRNFNFDGDSAQPLYLLFGWIDDSDEVFINGRRIGGEGLFPPNYTSAWNHERVYRVPEGVVNNGGNIIAVRVYDGYQIGGISGETIGLYTTTLPQPLIELSGEWKFRTGNNPEWKHAAIDESGFETILVPFDWDAFGYRHYDGYAWYRKTFGRLPVPEDETLVLLLGKIDDADEVFLNGQPVGRTDAGANSYRVNRIYEFPSSLLEETNTLAVRVYDGQAGGGIYSGPLGIMSKTDYLARKKQITESGNWNFDKTIDWLLGRS